LIATGYGVNEYHVIGPRWLDSERYEVTAELPEGKTRAQANIMLQNLLAERFGLNMHRETKEMEIYELRIAKGGPKLRESGPFSPTSRPLRNASADAYFRGIMRPAAEDLETLSEMEGSVKPVWPLIG
jgi:uncharacterized protein (TIGR03435 family)